MQHVLTVFWCLGRLFKRSSVPTTSATSNEANNRRPRRDRKFSISKQIRLSRSSVSRISRFISGLRKNPTATDISMIL